MLSEALPNHRCLAVTVSPRHFRHLLMLGLPTLHRRQENYLDGAADYMRSHPYSRRGTHDQLPIDNRIDPL
jgi:hypothetical protein